MYCPWLARSPVLRAADSPRFSWRIKWTPGKRSAIFAVSSVEPSSTTMISTFAYVCPRALPIASEESGPDCDKRLRRMRGLAAIPSRCRSLARLKISLRSLAFRCPVLQIVEHSCVNRPVSQGPDIRPLARISAADTSARISHFSPADPRSFLLPPDARGQEPEYCPPAQLLQVDVRQ